MTAYLSLYRLEISAGETARWPDGVGAALIHSGDTSVQGEAVFIERSTPLVTAQTDAVLLCFMLSQTKGQGPTCLESRAIDVVAPFLFRLDEVAFPPGAQAYRHVHPGPGFRHLRWGVLHLVADDHSFDAHPGDTWFEAAHSPVRATATEDADETRFVRCMILPVDYEGKPTITILDPQDADRPKRQTTHRHVDRILDQVDAG